MKKQTILVADDSPTMRAMLEEILTEGGYKVLMAQDGIQAAIMAFEHYPDLIVSDIEMPKMDGYQVCRLLKNDPQSSNTPVIILTSKDSSGSVFWGYQTGADLYVLKDFKPPELIASIDGLLKKYENESETTPDAPQIEPVKEKMDAFRIMEKLNHFMDNRLFEMTLINQVNQATVNLTTVSETLTSLLEILDRAIENHLIGFAIFTGEREILLSIKLSKPIPRKVLEIFQYQSLEDLAVMVNKDISDFNIDVEVIEGADVIEEETGVPGFDPNLIYSNPIRAKGQVFGILNVYHPQMPTISLYQKQLLEKLSPYISTAIGAISMHNKIKGLSVIDGLTQLYNRRYIMEIFKTEFSKTTRYESDLSILMIDIDDFKKINDTYGHLSGDLVLKTLSTLIRNSLRNVDLPGRYGGEEFILILPETGKENGVLVAERIRERIEKHTFKTMNGDPLTLTISIGLSELSDLENKTNELEMIKIADARLYKAKRTGKNKVISQ
ncbi:MAG: diguanylate cyclase [bacterium]|nr:diguanylate cyclase [bacterium]